MYIFYDIAKHYIHIGRAIQTIIITNMSILLEA